METDTVTGKWNLTERWVEGKEWIALTGEPCGGCRPEPMAVAEELGHGALPGAPGPSACSVRLCCACVRGGRGCESESCSIPGAVLWWRDRVRVRVRACAEPLGAACHAARGVRAPQAVPAGPDAVPMAPGSRSLGSRGDPRCARRPFTCPLSEHSRRMLMRDVGAALVSVESQEKVGPARSVRPWKVSRPHGRSGLSAWLCIRCGY